MKTKKVIREIKTIRFYEDEIDLIEKFDKLKHIFNEKTNNKVLKKILKTYEIK